MDSFTQKGNVSHELLLNLECLKSFLSIGGGRWGDKKTCICCGARLNIPILILQQQASPHLRYTCISRLCRQGRGGCTKINSRELTYFFVDFISWSSLILPPLPTLLVPLSLGCFKASSTMSCIWALTREDSWSGGSPTSRVERVERIFFPFFIWRNKNSRENQIELSYLTTADFISMHSLFSTMSWQADKWTGSWRQIKFDGFILKRFSSFLYGI